MKSVIVGKGGKLAIKVDTILGKTPVKIGVFQLLE